MSLASLWVTWKRHQHQIGYILVGIVLFAAGWQTGRVTSPYYASNPIVFEESANMPAAANTGSTEDLIALQQAGQQLAGDSSAVAAATTSVSPSIAPIGDGARLFVGSKNSDLYHHKDCPSGKRIKEENQIWWATREAAEAAGYAPSQCTKEKLGNT